MPVGEVDRRWVQVARHPTPGQVGTGLGPAEVAQPDQVQQWRPPRVGTPTGRRWLLTGQHEYDIGGQPGSQLFPNGSVEGAQPLVAVEQDDRAGPGRVFGIEHG